MVTRQMYSGALHKEFENLEIRDTCTWYGVKWCKGCDDCGAEPTKGHVLPCGDKAVGAGLFCDPKHTMCEYHSLCERHSNRPVEKW